MRSTVLLRNVVRVAEHALLVGVVPLHRDLNIDDTLLSLEAADRLMHGGTSSVQVFDERPQTTGVLKHVGSVLPLIDEFDAHAGVQKRQLAQTLGEHVVVKLNVGEDLGAGPKADDRAALGTVPGQRQRSHGHSEVVHLAIHLALPADGELQIGRQGVDHRHAHAVQSAGNLVGAVVEFSAGVQHRHDDLGCRTPLLRMDIHRNAASVVRNGYGFVCMDGDNNPVTMARQGLVDRVVHHLENHVVQTRSVIGVTDVHAGPFAHCIKSL